MHIYIFSLIPVFYYQIIASCSEDSNVIIWEEQGKRLPLFQLQSCLCLCPESVTGSDGAERGRWQKKSQLTDSKKAVNDVKFAPRVMGLM